MDAKQILANKRLIAVMSGSTVRPVIFNALAVSFFLLVGYLAISGRATPVTMWGAVVSASLCAIFGNIQHIESFKASATGIEAKTRELQATLDSANATVKSLHELATILGAWLVKNIAGSGRLGGDGSVVQRDRLKHQVIEQIKSLGVSEEAQKQVDAGDRYWICNDYRGGILRFSISTIGTISKEKPDEWREIQNLHKQDPENLVLPDEIDRLLMSIRYNDAFSKELLEDFRYYLERGSHRDPNRWSSRESWPERQQSE